MVHKLVTTGSYDLVQRSLADGPNAAAVGTRAQLAGRLSFIDFVDESFRASWDGKDPAANLSASRTRDYAKFLMFDRFYSSKLPVVLCEGDTDRIYLAHAIHKKAAAIPGLSIADASGKLKIAVRFHKYKSETVRRVLGLGGGTANIASFIRNYLKAIRNFSTSVETRPLVIVLDNDDGKSPIGSAIKQYVKDALDPSNTYTHVFANMYIVLTPPLAGGAESCIEDCFDTATRDTVFEGKTLSLKSTFDNTKHFSKAIFAHAVVRPNAATINFSGFDELLSRIQLAIAAHPTKLEISTPAG